MMKPQDMEFWQNELLLKLISIEHLLMKWALTYSQ